MNPIITQYSQKSLNSLCILGFGFLIGGNRRSKTAITGIKTPKFPAELDAFSAPEQYKRDQQIYLYYISTNLFILYLAFCRWLFSLQDPIARTFPIIYLVARSFAPHPVYYQQCSPTR